MADFARLLRRLSGGRADGRLALRADPRRDEPRAGHRPDLAVRIVSDFARSYRAATPAEEQ